MIEIAVGGEMYFLLSLFVGMAFDNCFNLSSLEKSIVATMEEPTAQKIRFEQERTDLQSHLDKKREMGEYIQNPEITVITPNPIWVHYIISLAKMDEEKITTLQTDIDELENQLYELETKLKFYNQVPERNFWQYLRSMKWIKKSKKQLKT